MWGAVMLQLAVIAAVAPSPAAAYAASCSSAETNLAARRKALAGAIEAYAACVSRAGGQDDCAATFRKVRAAQSAFATAIADLKGSCPPE
jgi:hypothetical protein